MSRLIWGALMVFFYHSANADFTRAMCPDPQIDAFLLGGLVGKELMNCGLSRYADRRIKLDDEKLGFSGSYEEDCREVHCRAINAKKIIINAKQAMNVAEPIARMKGKKNPYDLSSREIRRIKSRVNDVDKMVARWQRFSSKNFGAYTYSEAEMQLHKSLEKRTLKLSEALPSEVVQNYRAEQEELRVEAEKQRIVVERARKEQQRAQTKEKRKQAEVLRSKETKRRRQLRATEKAESVCVWTGTVGRNYLFLPFTHSNCIWFDLVPPSFWWLMNLVSLYLIYKLLLSPFTIGDRVTQQKNDSLFDKHGISPGIETDLPETGAPGRDSFFQKHGVS